MKIQHDVEIEIDLDKYIQDKGYDSLEDMLDKYVLFNVGSIATELSECAMCMSGYDPDSEDWAAWYEREKEIYKRFIRSVFEEVFKE